MRYLAAILVLTLFACKKTEQENPKPTVCPPKIEKHHFKIEGAGYYSEVTFNGEKYSGTKLPLPEFDLITGESFQFMDSGYQNMPRTITIYIDGEILQKWSNADYIIKYEYKVR